MIEAGTISAGDLELMLVTDSIADAMAHIEQKAVVQFGLIRSRRPRPSVLLGESPRHAMPGAPSTSPRPWTRRVSGLRRRFRRTGGPGPAVHGCADVVMYS
jgi:hypothetical protein